MRFLLDHLSEGVAVVDRSGRLQEEHSRALELWFEAPAAGQPVWELIADPAARRRFETAWSVVAEDVLPLELALDQLPSCFLVRGRQLRLRVDPVCQNDGAVTQFLVFFTDITMEIEQEKADMAARETAAVLAGLSRDRTSFVAQMHDIDALVAVVVASSALDAAYRRQLHTLKGNAGLLGFPRMARICHDLENALAADDRDARLRAVTELDEAWRTLRMPIGDPGTCHVPTVEISRAELAELEAAAVAGVSRAHLARRLRALSFEPAERKLERLAGWARDASRRQGNPEVVVHVDGGGLKLDPALWGGFWGELVHVVRNAITHGIEPASERVARGKPPRGTLVLRCTFADDRVIVEVSDDGRGVDWQAVRARAEAIGVPAATPHDLERALFLDGFSTSAVVDELSGRGEGLAALQSAVERLDGAITIVTAPERGTTLRVAFPVARVGDAIAEVRPLPRPHDRGDRSWRDERARATPSFPPSG